MSAKRRRVTLDPVTPRHRSVRRAAATPAAEAGPAEATEQFPPPPEGLYSKTWKLFSASPLFKFRSDSNAKFREYGKKFAAFLQARKHRGSAVAVSGLSAGSLASFGHLQNVAWSEHDPPAIHVQAEGLEAVLCSVGAESVSRQDFTHYPVILIKAGTVAAKAFLEWLERTFDCRTAHLELSPIDLIWIATEWAVAAESVGARGQRPLELTYTTPHGVEGITTIKFSVDPATVRELRDSVLDAEGTEVLEGLQLVEAIEAQFFETFKIRLGAMTLSCVGTYCAYVAQEGKLKLLKGAEEHKQDAAVMLSFLTHVVLNGRL